MELLIELLPKSGHLLIVLFLVSVHTSGSLEEVYGKGALYSREIYDMKRFYRAIFVILGSVSFILTAGLCLPMPLVAGILPPMGSFPLHIFLASITAAISASLLWVGFSGELGAVTGGAINSA